MAQNSYTVNGGIPIKIEDGSADIDMSTEAGVMAGCRQYPIPLLNKITVTSTEEGLYSSRSIYAGYKVVNQLLGDIVATGNNYDTETSRLNTIISIARFGMFEPAHYNESARSWDTHNMNAEQINSLINVGAGVKICVKIEYTKSDGTIAKVYVPIDDVNSGFERYINREVPRYSAITATGEGPLNSSESVVSDDILGYNNRTWFESVLGSSALNVNLNITDPNTAENFTVTLMAYIGTMPTANNTSEILPMSANSKTSITCQFKTYNPTIYIMNKDGSNNYDAYEDSYGSVADYDTGTDYDTTININIVPPTD